MNAAAYRASAAGSSRPCRRRIAHRRTPAEREAEHRLRPPGHALGQRDTAPPAPATAPRAPGPAGSAAAGSAARSAAARAGTRPPARMRSAPLASGRAAVRVTRRSMSRSHMSLTTQPAPRITTRADREQQDQTDRRARPAPAPAGCSRARAGRAARRRSAGRAGPAPHRVRARRGSRVTQPSAAISVQPATAWRIGRAARTCQPPP